MAIEVTKPDRRIIDALRAELEDPNTTRERRSEIREDIGSINQCYFIANNLTDKSADPDVKQIHQQEIADHPLNQAAMELLERNKIRPSDHWTPILQVAATVYQVEGREDDWEAILLSRYSQMDPLTVLELLSEEIDPQTLAKDSLQEAAQSIIQALTPLDPYRDLR